MLVTLLFQVRGGVAQMVERALSMREVPGSMPGTSNRKVFASFHNVKALLLLLENHSLKRYVSNTPATIARGCSSDGRARALHVRGTGIDARHLQSNGIFVLPQC